MARWRPPKPRSSPYITAQGRQVLDAELKALWVQRRTDVVPALRAAAAEGDRSENAEYIYRKKQLAEMDRRIRYLSRRLDEVKVVHGPPPRRDQVYFGAWVTVEDEGGAERCYRIVGSDETDAAKGWISVDSPVARTLLGRRVDDEVTVVLPERRMELVIVSIRYEG
jgi:transcription elongation factor GreB